MRNKTIRFIRNFTTGRKVPESPLSQTHPSLTNELIPRNLYTAETVSKSCSILFDWICTACGDRIKDVSVATRTQAVDEGRIHRGCQNCAERDRREKAKPEPLPDWLKEQCIDEPDRAGFTSVKKLMTNAVALRLWQCPICRFRWRATVSARLNLSEKKDQSLATGCPTCLPAGYCVDLKSEKFRRRYLKMLVLDWRNAGYVQLLNRFPLDHKVNWRCLTAAHQRYASLKEVLKAQGCLTCFEIRNKKKLLSDLNFNHTCDSFCRKKKQACRKLNLGA